MSIATHARRSEAAAGGAPKSFRALSGGMKSTHTADVFAREAPRSANTVIHEPSVPLSWSLSRMNIDTPLQRKCSSCRLADAEEGSESLTATAESHAKPSGSPQSNEVPPLVTTVLRSTGRPLESNTKSFFEARFGYDFSRVRIHTDNEAARSATSVQALAYTAGANIVFGKGQYAPSSDRGRALLAHELSHVVQQEGSGSPEGKMPTRLGAPGDAYEGEASRVASQVLQTHSLEVKGTAQQRGLLSKPRIAGLMRSPIMYLARQCLNPDICGKYKTKATCPEGTPCGYGKSGVCKWPSIAVGCCCLGAQQRVPQEQEQEAPEREKKTTREDAERRLRELLPTWIIVALGAVVLAALIACFATGVCEAGLILGAAGAAVAVIVIAVLRHAGVEVRGGPPMA